MATDYTNDDYDDDSDDDAVLMLVGKSVREM